MRGRRRPSRRRGTVKRSAVPDEARHRAGAKGPAKEIHRLTDLDQMKVLMPFICGTGSAYRCKVVGFPQDGKAYSRAECVFDATSPLPRILLWRDLTHLGRGYSLDSLGVNYSQ